MKRPVDILQKYWAYEDFRPPQAEIIDKVLQKKDVIAVLPTGSGKSVIYQVAGLAQQGLTIVISPLIALMEDQINALNQKGIKAIALSGSLPFSELERLLDNAAYGQTKFLYLSPERLQNSFVQKRLLQMPINLIAVDEAHCISEWGHDFRPSYLKISILRELMPDVPVLALTATAKSRVVDDINNYLKLDKPELFKQSVFRNNIAYQVLKTQNKIGLIGELLSKKATAIVYVRTRKRTYQFAEILSQQGFKTGYFHGGMSFEQKQKSLNDWLQDKTKVMFATNAFGMGIDKPDVRHVFHIDLPGSLENYVQESGRAGRDGNASKASILINATDIDSFEQNYLKKVPEIDEVYQVLSHLYNQFHIAEGEGKLAVKSLDFAAFCTRFKLDAIKTYQALQILDSEEMIALNQTQNYFASVKIIYKQSSLRRYIEHKQLGYHLLNFFVRSYTDIFYLPTPIKMKEIANRFSITKKDLHQLLLTLQERGVIEYQPEGEDFSITFLVNRDDKAFKFRSKYLKKRIEFKKDQLKHVLAYVLNDKMCRANFLAKYFEEKPDSDCGICDVCINKFSRVKEEDIRKDILKRLAINCLSKQEIQKEYPIKIDAILDELMEQNLVAMNNQLKYCL